MLALAVTFCVQMLASFVLGTPAVLAPVVAPEIGFTPERVGLFVGVAYLMAMLSGLWSGHGVARLGAVGLSQVAMLACALGAFAGTAATVWLLFAAAIAIGCGYGIINPASTILLEHHSPNERRSLFFSIKQTGVPMGVALAGLLMPWGLSQIGWKASVALAGLVCAVASLALFPGVRRLRTPSVRTATVRSTSVAHDRAVDATGVSAGPSGRSQTETPGMSGASAAAEDAPAVVRAGPAALWLVLRDPVLRRLSLTSLTFATTQLVFLTFLVSLLNLQLGHTLAWAAGILAAAQVVSTMARIGLGYVADRWLDAALLLGLLGLAMAASLVGLALLRPGSADWVVLAAATFCSATGMGWNGVYFAELARTARRRADLATVAGASQFFTFAGSMLGPVVFAGIIRAGGSWSLGFALFALLPAASGAALLRAWARSR